MSVRIGINPLTWTNDDLPSLGAETPLDTCLSEGRAAGFSGFELGNKFPRKAEVLGPILEGHNLSLVSGWFSGELLSRSVEEEIAAINPHLELLSKLGANAMVYCEVTHCIHGAQNTPVSQRPFFPAERWSEFGDKLSAVAEHCLASGVKIAYHHHMGTVIESEQDVDNLMAHTSDAVGLLLDAGHITFAGGDPLSLLAKHGPRINHVHCKDIRHAVMKDAQNRNMSFLDAVLNGVFTVPGDGCVDFDSLFKGLVELDYNGWLVVEAEQDPMVAPSVTCATLGADNLKALCQRTGLVLVD